MLLALGKTPMPVAEAGRQVRKKPSQLDEVLMEGFTAKPWGRVDLGDEGVDHFLSGHRRV